MKILILSASPQRDSIIDMLIAEELTGRGHEVRIAPCLRQGRKAIIDFKPDIVTTPPIKNPNSRDLVEQCRKWNIGVVVRHTEPSCDWADYKAMDMRQREEICGKYGYNPNVEVVWGNDEADILNRRNAGFETIPVGALTLDVYKHDTLKKRFASKKEFCERYKFDPAKKTVLIASPWGFADVAPDLQIDDMRAVAKEEVAKKRHINMILNLKKKLLDWNVLVTLHPGIDIKPYIDAFKDEIPIDCEAPAAELLLNSDVLVHAGSTMAMEAHMLDMPAFQYYDQNCLRTTGWFDKPDGAISNVSPRIDDVKKLAVAIKNVKLESNANKESIEALENGRYGKMDGLAYKRVADIICKIDGNFTLKWPDPPRDYSQPKVKKDKRELIDVMYCNLCEHEFYAEKDAPINMFCPFCAARIYKQNVNRGNNTSKTE